LSSHVFWRRCSNLVLHKMNTRTLCCQAIAGKQPRASHLQDLPPLGGPYRTCILSCDAESCGQPKQPKIELRWCGLCPWTYSTSKCARRKCSMYSSSLPWPNCRSRRTSTKVALILWTMIVSAIDYYIYYYYSTSQTIAGERRPIVECSVESDYSSLSTSVPALVFRRLPVCEWKSNGISKSSFGGEPIRTAAAPFKNRVTHTSADAPAKRMGAINPL